ncbi:hypothetical protein Clacol_006020 [Clathrus columnatus]|uniref:Major facilitator superfamily (MFS) profile domain-containing protein n=1 Tax=Clathrus columnatus TaxID=1419009 RepID=A0AAV5ADJ9_9AGAM|nr:hypothetical protein Clacol_006020 [Clathrus columnatus]
MSTPNDERTPLLQQPTNNNTDVQAPQQTSKPQLGPLEISASNRRAILAGIWLATFLTNSKPPIKQAATCTFTPLYGRLSNVLGRRGANQTALFFAGLGTLFCGFSKSLPTLIAARFLAGMGGGGIFTTAAVITSDMYSLRDRSLAQGMSSVFNGAGMGLGGPLGGYISDRFGWRWAFLLQIPLFVVSFLLTGYNLRYVTPGRSKSTKEVLKRIDYGGSLTLFLSMGSLLFFLSYKYNDDLPFTAPSVLISMIIAFATFILFVVFELVVAPEPVSICNFAVMYFFPMFFETVMLTSASEAGTHLLPNSVSMSFGSLFAGYVMSSTGRYKLLDSIFGIAPFFATTLMSRLDENSGFFAQWCSIIPLGFGNAVVLQTTLIALLVSVEHSAMAVATGFNQLWRGIGQVWGVAFASAIFQSLLDHELRQRITGPDSQAVIQRLRHSSKLVISLPPELQIHARAAYAIALRQVFKYAAVSTLIAFLIRLAIPERSLDDRPTSEDQIKKDQNRPEGDIESNGNGIMVAQDNITDIDEDDDDDEPERGRSLSRSSPPTPGTPRPILRSSTGTTTSSMNQHNQLYSSPISRSISTSISAFTDSGIGPGGSRSRQATQTSVDTPDHPSTRSRRTTTTSQTQGGPSSRHSSFSQRSGRRTLSRRLSFYESTDGGMDLEDDEISGSARR